VQSSAGFRKTLRVRNPPARIEAQKGDSPVRHRAVLMNDRWEHFEHGADIGVRGLGATKAGAFEQAALALTAVIADPASVAPLHCVGIACEAADDEILLVCWLNAVLYEMAVRHMLFSRFGVVIEGGRLNAIAEGEALSVAKHRPAVEVKGATFTALRVEQGADGLWTAQTVVDV
jgi:tRNA nucleotidyltransferase (CCA-adding enzyme)